jgi:exopolyphosphatase / guanosine-5'-triphosphate,3'-diphosphate pyrophosphatase
MDRPVAAIDVGTNTVLLLVARREADGSLTPLVDAYRVPRLGVGVDARKILHPDAVSRVIAVLEEYRAIAVSHHAAKIVACATSAVRDAANRSEFMADVLRRTGLQLEVLSGEDEALLSFHGALSGITPTGPLLVLDIGGGSTELISGDAKGVSTRVSLDIGAVRLTERCFKHDPPSPEEILNAQNLIDSALAKVPQPAEPTAQLVAVAGTPTSLATLSLGLRTFSQNAVNGHTMPREEIERLWDQLRLLPSVEIRRLSEVMEGRADVITAGTLILRMVMDRFALSAVTASDRGLRYGLVMREILRLANTNGP